MSVGMTPEQCRAAQRECSKNVFDAIAELRRETKEDIGLIREAVQAIDRAVSQIKGYLGINGTGQPHPHHRDHEDDSTMHQRATDAISAIEKATLAMRPTDGITLPRWAAIGIAAFVLMVIALAMVAGKDGLTIWPKSHDLHAPMVVAPK